MRLNTYLIPCVIPWTLHAHFSFLHHRRCDSGLLHLLARVRGVVIDVPFPVGLALTEYHALAQQVSWGLFHGSLPAYCELAPFFARGAIFCL